MANMSSKRSFGSDASSGAEKRIRSRSWIMEEMETMLAEWLQEQIKNDVPLSRATICEKARLIFNDLKVNEEDAPVFNASLNWLYSFKARHGLKDAKIRREPTHIYVADEDYFKTFEPNFSFIKESENQASQANKETVTLTRPFDLKDGDEKNSEDLSSSAEEKPEEVVDLVSEDGDEEDKVDLIKSDDDELIPEDFLELELREEEDDNDSGHHDVEPPKYLKVKDFAQLIESHFMDATNEERTETKNTKCLPADLPTEENRKGKTQKTLRDFFPRKPTV